MDYIKRVQLKDHHVYGVQVGGMYGIAIYFGKGPVTGRHDMFLTLLVSLKNELREIPHIDSTECVEDGDEGVKPWCEIFRADSVNELEPIALREYMSLFAPIALRKLNGMEVISDELHGQLLDMLLMSRKQLP